MQLGFHFNQELCTHCCACVVACKDWHDVPVGPASYIRMAVIEKGRFPDVYMAGMFGSCYHCAEPACMPVCPVEAISKRVQDGIVIVDRDICLGQDHCGACEAACPYDAPQFGAEENARMQKCDLCEDRLAANRNPVCVDACPFAALDVGPLEALRATYGDGRQAEGFVYSSELKPSVVFTAMEDRRKREVQKTVVMPPVA